MARIQTLPGFHDLYPEDVLVRNYLFGIWRNLARRYGFAEFDAPLIESTDLYRKKSGEEILSQLFHFTDQGGRELALRPEITPSLARMAAARHRDYRKPIKWFEIGPCFRSEKPQRGRRREFIQFNCDIIGDDSPAADAELIALAIDLMRDLGFSAEDFHLRLSSRDAWTDFLTTEKIDPSHTPAFLAAIDKMERDPETSAKKLQQIGTKLETVQAFINAAQPPARLQQVLDDLNQRGLANYVKTDLSIVRGLAYYTGTVFEIFDAKHSMRAIAGGGRYDRLVHLISDGAADLPAVGFAMGNVVILDLIEACTEAQIRLQTHIADHSLADVFVIIADESRRPDALQTIQLLRDAGLAVDFPLTPTKFNKQFHGATAAKATVGVFIGDEFPDIKVKNLITRNERPANPTTLVDTVKEMQQDQGPLIA